MRLRRPVLMAAPMLSNPRHVALRDLSYANAAPEEPLEGSIEEVSDGRWGHSGRRVP